MGCLEEVKSQVELLSAQESAAFREWFYDFTDDLATAEQRLAAYEADESATCSLDEVERLSSLDKLGSTHVEKQK